MQVGIRDISLFLLPSLLSAWASFSHTVMQLPSKSGNQSLANFHLIVTWIPWTDVQKSWRGDSPLIWWTLWTSQSNDQELRVMAVPTWAIWMQYGLITIPQNRLVFSLKKGVDTRQTNKGVYCRDSLLQGFLN